MLNHNVQLSVVQGGTFYLNGVSEVSGGPRNFVWGGVQQIQLRTERKGIWGRR